MPEHPWRCSPVYLPTIGLAPDQPTDAFWPAILLNQLGSTTGCRDRGRHAEVRGYFNCGAIMVRPSLRLFREWARRISARLADADYHSAPAPTAAPGVPQAGAVGDHRRPHVTSAVALAAGSAATRSPAPGCGCRAARLADLSVVLHENEIDQSGALRGIRSTRSFAPSSTSNCAAVCVTERILREGVQRLRPDNGVRQRRDRPGGARARAAGCWRGATRPAAGGAAHHATTTTAAASRCGGQDDVPVIAQQGHAS
jgi:hypothetical protein